MEKLFGPLQIGLNRSQYWTRLQAKNENFLPADSQHKSNERQNKILYIFV